jgi:hypothetical protein
VQDQIRVLRLHAKHMGWKVIKTFIDQSINGARIAKGSAPAWQPHGELCCRLRRAVFVSIIQDTRHGCSAPWFDALHQALAVFI